MDVTGSNKEKRSLIWFQNKSTNKIDIDFGEIGNLDKKNWKKKQSSIQQDVSCVSFRVEIK